MRFCMSTISMLGRRLDDAILSHMKKGGIETIELFMQKPHFDQSDPSHISEISGSLKNNGMNAISAHMPIYKYRLDDPGERKLLTLSLCDPDDSEREFAISELLSSIEACGTLGIRNIVVHTGLLGPAGESEKNREIEMCVRSLKRPVERAGELGVNLSIENGTSPGVTVAMLHEVIKRISRPNLGICVDVGHSNLFSKPETDVDLSMPRLNSLHLHDNNGRSDQHYMPGEGMIAFDRIISILTANRFTGIVTLEVVGPLAENVTMGEFSQFSSRIHSKISKMRKGSA